MPKDPKMLRDLRGTIDAHLAKLALGQVPVIGWCCSYFPVEIIESAGLVPLRLLPLPPAEMGDAYLSPNFCPYVRALMGEGLGKTYPFLSGLVVMNTCDGMRRLSDAWSHFHDFPFVHLMDLPRMTSDAAIERFGAEIQTVADRVSSHFGVSVTKDAIQTCVVASNRTHDLVHRVKRLVGAGSLHVSGLEVSEVLRAGGILPRSAYNTFLERVIDARGETGQRGGVPILLTGSMLENADIVSTIEACGGNVVAYDLCVTGRHSEAPISLDGDSITALARHYLLKPPCARMQEIQRRIDYILGLIRSCGVQGVIYYVLKFCDTFLYEAPALKKRLGEMKIPMLIIESEYRKGSGGGMQTRIQAFLEMLRGSTESLALAGV